MKNEVKSEKAKLLEQMSQEHKQLATETSLTVLEQMRNDAADDAERENLTKIINFKITDKSRSLPTVLLSGFDKQAFKELVLSFVGNGKTVDQCLAEIWKALDCKQPALNDGQYFCTNRAIEMLKSEEQ